MGIVIGFTPKNHYGIEWNEFQKCLFLVWGINIPIYQLVGVIVLNNGLRRDFSIRGSGKDEKWNNFGWEDNQICSQTMILSL